jgi:hypothetical protein
MKRAPQIAEKWKRYAALFQQVWEHARNREELTAFLLTGPDLQPEELETVLTLIRTIPYVLRNHLQGAAKSPPPSPRWSAQKVLKPEQSKEVCLQIGQLFGLGVGLPDAQKRMANRYNVSLRTIQRAWRKRAKWKPDPA